MREIFKKKLIFLFIHDLKKPRLRYNLDIIPSYTNDKKLPYFFRSYNQIGQYLIPSFIKIGIYCRPLRFVRPTYMRKGDFRLLICQFIKIHNDLSLVRTFSNCGKWRRCIPRKCQHLLRQISQNFTSFSTS